MAAAAAIKVLRFMERLLGGDPPRALHAQFFPHAQHNL